MGVHYMTSSVVRARSEAVKERAHGHWTSILERLGVDSKLLNRKNQPCPRCGGNDRWQYTDRYGNGDHFCRNCGHGDGFVLLDACCKLPFAEGVAAVEQIVGAVQLARSHSAARVPSSEYMKNLAKKIWDAAKPVCVGDEVDQYLTQRGLHMPQYPATIRCHPKLEYYSKQDGEKRARVIAHYPAMIAPMQGPDGRAVTVHRTYVSQGRKADVPDAKKVLNSFNAGPAIRLFEPTDELAITEGIETALAVHLETGKPVWAAYSATNLEKIWIPESVKRVCIYADNDASFTGAASAYALAKRLRSTQRPGGVPEVHVFIPKATGEDWADVFKRKRLKVAA